MNKIAKRILLTAVLAALLCCFALPAFAAKDMGAGFSCSLNPVTTGSKPTFSWALTPSEAYSRINVSIYSITDDVTTVLWSNDNANPSDSVMLEITDSEKLYASASIFYTSGNYERLKSNTIKVTIPVTAITFASTTLNIIEGETSSVPAVTITPSNATNPDVSYYSEDDSIADVDAVTGEVTAVSEGETVIYAVADDGFGAEAELYVSVLPVSAPIALKITAQPQDVAVEDGETFTLSVRAQGSGLSYQWFVREPGKTGYSDAFCNTADLTETMTAALDGCEYYCLVTDAYSSFVESASATVTLIPDLKITSQPKDVMAKAGETVSFTVEASGSGLAYRWYVKTPTTNRFVDTKNISANYTFEMLESLDGNQYYCIVTDANGNTVQSNTVTLRLPKPVFIKTQPKNTSAAAGESVTVSVEAVGEGLTYKWYYKNPGDVDFLYTSTFTGNTYTMTMSESRDGRQVYCVVTDKDGNSVTSDTVTLSMKSYARITKQPQNAMAALGASVSVSVEAVGEGLTYEWFYKNKGDTAFTYTSTYTTNTYTMTMTNARAGREVYCIVTDVYGNFVKSNTVVLDILQPVYIRKQPESSFVYSPGDVASVTVDAVGDGLTYEWYCKLANAVSFTKLPAFTGNTYSVTMNAYDHNSRVYCIITDSQGNYVQSNIVTLGFYETAYIHAIYGGKAFIGSRATITLDAEGNDLTYKWYYKDPGAAAYTLSSVTGDTYSLVLTEARVGRQVYCVITDKYGYSATSDIVTLGEPQPVYIKVQPTSVSAFAGEQAKVSFTAIGDELVYQWYFRPAGEVNFVYTDTFEENYYYTTMSEARDGRQVYCVVTDKYGNTAQTNTVTLDMKHRAAITEEQKPHTITAAAGERFSITIKATGDGVTYQWYVKNKGASEFTAVAGQNGSVFNATMSTALDGARVKCIVTDEYGTTAETEYDYKLSVVTPVEITTQPTDAAAAVNTKATVKLTANGEGLTYKWYFKDKKATSFKLTTTFIGDTYEVTMNDTRDGRQVYCVVTDEHGYQVTSNTVTLSLKETVKITAQPQTTTAHDGERVSVTITATGDGLKYTWYVKEPGESGYTAYNNIGTAYSMVVNDYTTGTIVYCVVTDKYGNSEESNKVSVRKIVPVYIDSQTEDDVKVMLGEKATVTVNAIGDGLKYEWYFKDANASSFAKTKTFTGDTYSVDLTEARVGRQVYCVITDKYANKVTSNVVTLKRDYTLKILKQPVNKTVNEGKTATVTVEVNGAGLTYQWYVIKAGTVEVTKSSNTTSKYSVVMNDERSGNQVFCVITDKNGDSVTSDTVTLKMPIAIKVQPVSVKVKSGETASVSVNATGTGLKYKWYYKNPGDSSYKASSVTGDTYSVTMNEDRDGRKVYCLITDSKGNQVKSNAVSLTMKVELGITAQPKNVTVASGQKATVSIKATGVDLTYQWYVKAAGTGTFLKSSITSSKYSVTMNSARNGNQVYCVVTDKYGNTVKSKTVTLSME
ncbi:MAG: Ig domain-containing protein [Clostridia bacterium]|nr:Ig domain-containing protein [Clostridia bacterium]